MNGHLPLGRRSATVTGLNKRFRRYALLSLCTIAVLNAPVARAAPDNWLAAVNGDWSDGTKWSLGSSPSSSDDASIPFSGIAVSFNTNATVNSLANSSDLTILGGALAGSQAANASPLTANAGTLRLNGGGFSHLTLTSGAGTIAVAANGGNFLDSVILNHDLSLDLNGYIQLYNASSTSKSISLTGGGNGIQLRDGNAVLTVDATGAIHGSGAVYQTFGGATLANNGTITADQLGNTLSLSTSFITGAGTLAATNGGTLSIGGRLNGTALKANVDATPGSQVIVDGGGLSGTLASSTGTGLSFAATGGNFIDTATINGDLTFNGNAYAQAYNASILSGTINMAGTGNGIQLRDGSAIITVGSGGKIRGYGAVYQTFGGSTVANNGTIAADVATQTLTVSTSFITGTGILAATNGGTLSIGGRLNGTALKANVDATPGSQVLINGGGLSGTLASSTGTGLSFAANGGNFIDTATINGDLTFNGNAYAQVYNSNTLSGTINMAGTGNGIQLRDGNAIITVGSGGKIRGYGAVYQTFGGSTVANNGTISADVATQTLTFTNSNITGSGLLEAKNGGTLSLGALVNGSGAVVHVDANPASTVLLNGGGLTGSFASSTGTGITIAANGGNYIDAATIAADLTVPGNGYVQMYNASSVSGTINMTTTGNGIQLRDGNATLTIAAGGKLQGYGTVYETLGGSTLANNGTIAANIAGQTLALNNSFINNAATISVPATLSVGGTLTQTAGQTAVDGTLSLAQTFQLQGGSLTGSGQILGSVNNSGAAVAPGASPGLLTITGNYNQQSAGLFDVQLGGVVPGLGYDQLVVGGAADLAGSINVNLIGGFIPTVGQQFDVMLRSTGGGTFSNLLTNTPGLAYTVDYQPTRVIITITAAVPEPAAIALFVCGLSIAAIARPRKK